MARQRIDLRDQCRYKDILVIEGFHAAGGSCWLAADWPVAGGCKREHVVVVCDRKSGCSAGTSLCKLGDRGYNGSMVEEA